MTVATLHNLSQLIGDLTIKGVTRQVAIPFEFQGTAR